VEFKLAKFLQLIGTIKRTQNIISRKYHFTKIRPVGTQWFHADGHDEANSPFLRTPKMVLIKHRTKQFGCQYRNAAADISFKLLACGTIGVLRCLMCQIVNTFNRNISWPRI